MKRFISALKEFKETGGIQFVFGILLWLVMVVLASTQVSAQGQTFYDANGRIVGRSTTDNGGTTTIYNSTGRVLGRSSRDGNQTTVYDSRGSWRGKIKERR